MGNVNRKGKGTVKMKKLGVAMSLVLATVSAQAALPEISNVVARQRWPWSGKVDIDFEVGAGDVCDLAVTATYDGCAEPVDLVRNSTNLNVFGVGAGVYHFVWDPSADGLGDATLANFRVTVTAVPETDRKYLVLDLREGTCEYMSDVPEGGWTDEHKTRKLVMRRIPAGTYALGYPSDIIGMTFPDTGNKSFKAVASARNVTISAPYYIAIFSTTFAQNNALSGDGTSENKKPHTGISYNGLRGSYDTDGIDWPDTAFEVSNSSVVKKYRDKFAGAFPKSWIIDLPTAAQWEAAARAGASSTLWYNGGTSTDSAATLSACLSAIAVWNGAVESNVGTKTPNGFGLYDVAGNRSDWLLDLAFSNTNAALGDSTDPVGVVRSASSGNRLLRGGLYNDTTFFSCAIGNVAKNESPTQTFIGYRLCINTRNWVVGQ